MNKENGFIYDNLKILIEEKYVTEEELRFIFIAKELVDDKLNAIINIKQNRSFSTFELSETIGYKVDHTMEILDSLINKGIIYEFVNRNSDENLDINSVYRERTLFINPEIFYKGDVSRINPTLVSLINHYDIIEKNNIHLPKKLAIKSGDIFGELKDRVGNK